MEEIKQAVVEAYNWLAAEPPHYWTRSHFREFAKCDALLNNMCECFNAAILSAREASIIVMLEKLRNYLMIRMRIKREFTENYSYAITPKIRVLMNKIKGECGRWHATAAGAGFFQVASVGTLQYVVNINSRECTCRKWQLSGIPCAHAVSALLMMGVESEDYIDEYYSREAYRRTYANVIYPISGSSLWPRTGKADVEAPLNFRQTGRPKKARRKEPRESQHSQKSTQQGTTTSPVEEHQTRMGRKGKKVRCAYCHREGHNRRTCPNTQGNTQQSDQGDIVQQAINEEMEWFDSLGGDYLSNLVDIPLQRTTTTPLEENQPLNVDITTSGAHSSQEAVSMPTEAPIDGTHLVTCKSCLKSGQTTQMCPTPNPANLRSKNAAPNKKSPFLRAGRGIFMLESSQSTFSVASWHARPTIVIPQPSARPFSSSAPPSSTTARPFSSSAPPSSSSAQPSSSSTSASARE